MSDPIEETTAYEVESEPTTEDPEVEPSPVDPEDDEDRSAAKGPREAAKYRKRAQEAETARDAATARVTALTDALVAAAMPKHNVTLPLLHAAGFDSASFVSEDGSVDTAALQTAILSTREKFGIQDNRLIVRGEGRSPEHISSDVSWTKALGNV